MSFIAVPQTFVVPVCHRTKRSSRAHQFFEVLELVAADLSHSFC